ncbi:MAG: TlpA disulfide reductase family protein [Chloroherpetonaceae bacterium]
MKKIASWILPLGLAIGAGLLLSKYVVVPLLQPKPTAEAFSQAPLFSIQTIDGKTLSLSDLNGKGVIVNFWATWCPPCRAEIPHMIELQKEYKDRFTFIGIAINDQEEKVSAFVSQKGMNYPIAMDNGLSAIYGKLIQGGLESVPTSFVIDKNGKVIEVIVGMADKVRFERAIQSSLQ